MTTAQQALAPVRDALLRAARADAEALLARAERESADLLDRARAEARAILDEARRQGEADGAATARDVRVRARRAARSRVLSARRQTYEELRLRAIERVRDLRSADDYPSVLDALERRARRLLGPDADITQAPGGGVVARTADRRLDLALGTLAARALDRIGADVESLWRP